MNTWRTAGTVLSCGHCGARIPAGEPFRAVWVPSARHRWVRCAACATRDAREPAPAWDGPDGKRRASGDD